jgi:DNA-binding transcriptional ArsR family regulator
MTDRLDSDKPSAGDAIMLDAAAVQRIARAIADPSRYEILRTLAAAACNTPCSAVRNCVDLAPPTLSHHMKELRDAGLVEEQHVGRIVLYTLRRDVFQAFTAFLQQTLVAPAGCAGPKVQDTVPS